MRSQDQKQQQQDKNLIAIGSDHGGWELKEYLKEFLIRQGFLIEDLGLPNPDRCDYPVIGIKLARLVSEGKIKRGILICGTGIGMSIVANRFPGVRAALCHNMYTARMSREHNNSNVLVLGGRVLGKSLAEEILRVWLYTNFPDTDGRHSQRLKLITNLEKEMGLG
jgi:ribose 5-phosphate isomerase B